MKCNPCKLIFMTFFILPPSALSLSVRFSKITRRVQRSRLSSSAYSLLMETPIQIRGLAEIADRYDLFLFDQFGVLHDCVKPVDGTISMLNELRKLNKTAVIVSNTSNRSAVASNKLNEIGFPSSSFDGGVVTSGESAHKWISNLCTEEGPKKCCFITWRDGKASSAHGANSFLSSLQVNIAAPEDADFIFFHGTQNLADADPNSAGTPIDLYMDGNVNEKVIRGCLEIAASRQLPAVCANLDMIAMVPSGAAYMPGLLKESYESMGGTCVGFGKPNRDHFTSAVEMASIVHRKKYGISDNIKLRALHIGDSLHHDIAGTKTFHQLVTWCFPTYFWNIAIYF